MSIRVLIVEDDGVQSGVLAAFLQGRGFYVETAENGLEAVRKARVGWFDIVLMDYHLPQVDGLGAAKLIAEFARISGRPKLIALTSAPDELSARKGCTEDVFDAMLSKPWTPDLLLSALAHAHAGAEAARDWTAIWKEVTPSNRLAALTPLADPPTPHEEAERLRVLIVEDDQMMRMVLKGALESCGYEVAMASDGLQALRLNRQYMCDIAILDYQMPDMDGLATARLVYDLALTDLPPQVIGLTANPAALIKSEAGAASVFHEIVDKSAGVPEVLQAVKRCAEYRRLHAESGPVNVLKLAPWILTGVCDAQDADI